MYKELFLISLDEQAARLAGVPVRLVNFVFTLMTAVTVSIAARTVGALIVSSLMVIPVICAMQIGRSYRQTLIGSVSFAVLFTVTGLFLSYYAGLKPGATIVLAGILGLLIILAVKGAIKWHHQRSASARPPESAQ
jgi:zinc transport system permease protein